jgi:putative molybdopterin biosynthesis protein
VSAYLAFELFAKPLIERMSGETKIHRQVMQAVIARRIVSSLKYKEFIRIKAGVVAGRLVAAPLARGAGAAMSLVRSDGFCVIDQNCEGVQAGESVSLILDKPMREIENTVVSVGSHDLILDLIADLLPKFFPDMSLSSTHVGSMAGLMALQRKETTIAPIHLLDEDSGEYNISYIKSMFPENSMALIKGVGRVQGILVKKGNPLKVKGFEDLTRVRYVNRQRGAGTRLLFDHYLKAQGISTTQIIGYEREAATHMAVAAAVRSDSADAGMGIMSAARSMKLDFIPVGNEEYDFAIRRCDLDSPSVKAFIATLQSAKLKDNVLQLGGYETEHCGEIVLV